MKWVYSTDLPSYALCFVYDISEDSRKSLSVTIYLAFSLTLDMLSEAAAFYFALKFVQIQADQFMHSNYAKLQETWEKEIFNSAVLELIHFVVYLFLYVFLTEKNYKCQFEACFCLFCQNKNVYLILNSSLTSSCPFYGSTFKTYVQFE